MQTYICTLAHELDDIYGEIPLIKEVKEGILRTNFEILIEYMLEKPNDGPNESYDQVGMEKIERIKRLLQDAKENPLKTAVRLRVLKNDGSDYWVNPGNMISDYLPEVLQSKQVMLDEKKENVLLLELIVQRVACEPNPDYTLTKMDLFQK